MKKIGFMCCGIFSLVFSQEFSCTYKMEGVEKNVFQPVLVEVIHDTLRTKFQEITQDFTLETSALLEKKQKDCCTYYVYHINLPLEREEAKMMLAHIFSNIKSKISDLDVATLKSFVAAEIGRKLGTKCSEFQNKALKQLDLYLEDFSEEKKLEFLEGIQLIIGENETIFSELDDDLRIESTEGERLVYISNEGYQFSINASDKDKRIINKIISEMGSKSLFSLLKKRGEMLRLGDQIRHVPPMDFLAVIFTQPDLKHHMSTIKKSYLKWSNIVDEVGNNMNKESKLPGFEEKVKAFARLVGADSSVLLRKAEEKDWSGFVSSLF